MGTEPDFTRDKISWEEGKIVVIGVVGIRDFIRILVRVREGLPGND